AEHGGGDLGPVHLRHVEVAKHELGLLLAHEADDLLRDRRRDEVEAAADLHPQVLDDGLVIVHHEDALAGGHSILDALVVDVGKDDAAAVPETGAIGIDQLPDRVGSAGAGTCGANEIAQRRRSITPSSFHITTGRLRSSVAGIRASVASRVTCARPVPGPRPTTPSPPTKP